MMLERSGGERGLGAWYDVFFGPSAREPLQPAPGLSYGSTFSVDASGSIYNADGSVNGPLTARNQSQGAAMSTNRQPVASADLKAAADAQITGEQDAYTTYISSQFDNATTTGGEVATGVANVVTSAVGSIIPVGLIVLAGFLIVEMGRRKT